MKGPTPIMSIMFRAVALPTPIPRISGLWSLLRCWESGVGMRLSVGRDSFRLKGALSGFGHLVVGRRHRLPDENKFGILPNLERFS